MNGASAGFQTEYGNEISVEAENGVVKLFIDGQDEIVLTGAEAENLAAALHYAGNYAERVANDAEAGRSENTYRVHLGGKRYRYFATVESARPFLNAHFERTGIALSIEKNPRGAK